MTIYKIEVVHYPFRSWIEYFTDKELAAKAHQAADCSRELYINDAGTSETNDVELYLYGRISTTRDYNNTPEQIRAKAFGEEN